MLEERRRGSDVREQKQDGGNERRMEVVKVEKDEEGRAVDEGRTEDVKVDEEAVWT